jgi:hypothetical protein
MNKQEILDLYAGIGSNALDLMRELDKMLDYCPITRSDDGSLVIYHHGNLHVVVGHFGVEFIESEDKEPEEDKDTCDHEWVEAVDSMYSSLYQLEVSCSKCKMIGELDVKTRVVLFPAT